MRNRLVLAALIPLCTAAAAQHPLALHPENPHYFLFRGKPTVLVTSGEHYGAVLNLDFNYKLYLKTLAAGRLNCTRVFSGAYRENPGDFHIAGNVLAPKPGRFIAPWAEADGKFDLMKWNEAYFARLRDFMSEAANRGIVVEMNLFCPFYEDGMWNLSPMNAKNNVNGIGNVKRTDVYTLKDKRLTAVQVAMVAKIVSELREFDNLYYEICNEPYFGGVTAEWQRHIARTIAGAEAPFEHKHLISQNIANNTKKIEDPDPAVSIFNFHYARPPAAVRDNYALNKVIGCNETGFDGNADATYRIQGWDFLMAGGALYNNLDYSFTAGHEDGTFQVPETNPGGGSPALRRQLRVLRAFFDNPNFIAMRPAQDTIASSPNNATARVLAEEGKQYAIYLHRGRLVKGRKPPYNVDAETKLSQFSLRLPAGNYKAQWIDPRTGKTLRRENVRHSGGIRAFESPVYSEDIALRISG